MKNLILSLLLSFVSLSTLGQRELVKDINLTPSSSMPLYPDPILFEEINGRTVFLANLKANGLPSLISLDSSNHQETVLHDFSVAPYYNRFIKFKDDLYFITIGSSNSYELWKTNGTKSGTVKVKDNTGASYPIITDQNFMYFWKPSPTGIFLTKSDGTESGTTTILNLPNIVLSPDYTDYIIFNHSLIYINVASSYSINKIDLSSLAISTLAFNNTTNGYYPHFTTNVDCDTALFFSERRNDQSYVWKVKASNFNTKTIDTLDTNLDKFYRTPGYVLYFSDTKLKSLGSSGNKPTTLCDTLRTMPHYSQTIYASVLNSTLYFIAAGKNSGYKLWKSDGTKNGTVVIRELPAAPIDFFVMDNFIYFKLVGQPYLWRSDGTFAQTTIASTLPNVSIDSLTRFKKNFWVANHKAFFWGNSSSQGSEPYFTNGTTSDIVADLNVSNESSFPLQQALTINGVVYFMASDGLHGHELWKTEGNGSSTTLIKDIATGPRSSNIGNMVEMNGILYFTANDGVHGNELWRSDGTEIGTYMIKDIRINYPIGSSPSNLVIYKGTLYFFAQNNSNFWDIWQSDGTEIGTTLFKSAPRTSSYIGSLLATDKNLFFTMQGNQYRYVVWTSDGTPSGTFPLHDLPIAATGLAIFNPTCFAKIGTKAYFLSEYIQQSNTNTYTPPRQALFVSDGTEIGTQIVKDFGFTQTADSLGLLYNASNLFLTEVNQKLYFSVRSWNAQASQYYYHLWESDASTNGTKLLNENSKTTDGYYQIGGINNTTYYLFSLSSYTSTDSELWAIKNDSTVKLQVIPFPDRGSFQWLTLDDSLYFKYYDYRSLNTTILNMNGLNYTTYLQSRELFSKMISMDGEFYFNSYDDSHGVELWKLNTCNYVISKQSGDWDNPTSWMCNRTPTSNDTVIIKSGHVIDAQSGIKQAKKIILRGSLSANTSTISLP